MGTRRGRAWDRMDEGTSCPRRIRRFLEPCLLLLLHRGDAHGYELAEAIISVVGNKADYVRSREEIAGRWSTERAAAGYEALFERLLERRLWRC